MLFMVVEYFKDTERVYRRFREKGRMMPEGLNYVSSWVGAVFQKCFQRMETGDVKLLDEWIEKWRDIVDFEVFPVITSAEAAEQMAARI
jgi:hypothetical protein